MLRHRYALVSPGIFAMSHINASSGLIALRSDGSGSEVGGTESIAEKHLALSICKLARVWSF